MTWYGTEYTAPGGGRYTSRVWARSREEARQIMYRRRLGEVPGDYVCLDEPRASELLRRALDKRVRKKPKPMDVIHALCWLSYLAESCHRASHHETVGDNGFLHAAAHWLSGIFEYRRADWMPLVERVRRVEDSIPGYAAPTPSAAKKPGR